VVPDAPGGAGCGDCWAAQNTLVIPHAKRNMTRKENGDRQLMVSPPAFAIFDGLNGPLVAPGENQKIRV
jgi:hypothetical protein